MASGHGTAVKAALLAAAVLLASATSVAAKGKPLPSGPVTPPPGYTFTTEEAEQIRHEAYWNQFRAEAAMGPIPAEQHLAGQQPAVMAVQSVVGGRRITGPNFKYGSGLIEESNVSAQTLSTIKSVSLKILSAAWRSVGKVASNITFLYGLIPSDPQPAWAKSYRSHSYYSRDGEYFRDGAWWVGARVERRATYALGWLLFYDAVTGLPHARFDNRGVGEFIRNDDSCHYADNAWINGMTQHGYEYQRVFIAEPWNACSHFNP